MLMYDSLSLEVAILHLRLVLFFTVIVLVIILFIVKCVALEVLTIVSLVSKRRGMHVVAHIIVLTPNCVVAIAVKVVPQGVVIALVFEYVEAVFVICASTLGLDFFFAQLDAKDAPSIVIEGQTTGGPLGRDVDTRAVIEATDCINAILVVVETGGVVETTLVQDVKSILIVVACKLLDLFLA